MVNINLYHVTEFSFYLPFTVHCIYKQISIHTRLYKRFNIILLLDLSDNEASLNLSKDVFERFSFLRGIFALFCWTMIVSIIRWRPRNANLVLSIYF